MKLPLISVIALVALPGAAAAQTPYSATELCPTQANSTGTGVVLAIDGVDADRPARARVHGGPAHKFGALIYGRVPAQPALPWGSGTLCIAPFHPGNGRYTVTPFSGTGEVEIWLNAHPQPAAFPFLPGETGYLQYQYRDTTGWNLSNALTVHMAP